MLAVMERTGTRTDWTAKAEEIAAAIAAHNARHDANDSFVEEGFEALADAGFHVAAVDLRGYGASDKPPRGYDAFTLSDDIAGLVRAMGASDATLIGHDWGGFLGWATAAMHPQVVRRLAVLSMPHPRCWASALVKPVPPGRDERRQELRVGVRPVRVPFPLVPHHALDRGPPQRGDHGVVQARRPRPEQ